VVSVAFKKASIQDLPLIYELAEEIWIPAFAPLFAETQLRALYQGMYNDKLLINWLKQKENDFFIALFDGQPKGYYATENHQKYLKLDKLYVHPDLQGQGVGKKILQEIVNHCRKKGIPSIELRVNRGNDGAIGFYKKYGFEIEKSVDFEGPNGFLYEDYIMAKSIIQ
jgi:ribosomal protein S18 acetylase RimI-like enzyme